MNKLFNIVGLLVALLLGATASAQPPGAVENTPLIPSGSDAASRMSDMVGPSHWSYQTMVELADAGVLSREFPKDGTQLSRAEMAIFTADAASNWADREDRAEAGILYAAMPDFGDDNSSSAGGGGPMNAQKVFSLVKEYQSELEKMGAKVTELEETLASLKVGEKKLNTGVDRLLKATGIMINGQAVVHSVNLLHLPTKENPFTGKLPAPQRSWPTVGYFDLKLTARPKKYLYAEVVYRMEKVFGGFWGSKDIAGVRRLYVRGDTDIGFQLGDVNYKSSPLTLWAQVDEFPFENDILARKRQENMDQTYLVGNAFPLQGVALDFTLVLFNSLDLELEAVGFKTGITGKNQSGLSFAKTAPYDQYIVGTRAHFTGTNNQAFRLGGSYFEIMEVVDSNNTVAIFPQQRNNVAAVDVGLNLAGGKFKANAEYATANYTPNFGGDLAWKGVYTSAWTTGTGINLGIDAGGKNHKMKAHYMSVEESFINYMAQTRVHDTLRDPLNKNVNGLGGLVTANNLWNPASGTYALNDAPNLFFQRFNHIVFATNQGAPLPLTYTATKDAQPGGVYLTNDVRQQSLPLGLATPNRAGFGGTYSGNFASGLLQPLVYGGMYSDIETAYNVAKEVGKRTYLRYGVGGKVDFQEALEWPLSLKAGVAVENIEGDAYVAFTSTQVDYNLDYEVTKGFHLLIGFEHIDYNGANFINMGSPLLTWDYMNVTVDSYSGGVHWRFSKSTDLSAVYNYHDVMDFENQMNNFGSQEFETKLTMQF